MKLQARNFVVRKPETIDITMFFKKFCIATRTKSPSCFRRTGFFHQKSALCRGTKERNDKMKKKLLSLLLILCLTALPIAGASAAYAPKYTAYADTLFGLGLFQGDGIAPDGSPSYRLGDGMTRAECIVMLLRLLGEEDAALAADRAAPFRDMTGHWAIRYVSYAYEKGYTSGTGADTFSPDDKASAKMYLTFLLRALGYNDKAGDFTYAAAYEKAAELGVCPKGAYTGDAAFLPRRLRLHQLSRPPHPAEGQQRNAAGRAGGKKRR